jgi:2'-5' RNA ligase
VFFALWPDPRVAAAIVRATRRAVRLSGGRPMAKDRLHVTVAFLGELDRDELERAQTAAPVATGAFDIVLDRLGFFVHSRVLWLAPRIVPQELHALEQQLWEKLDERGFEREPRIFRPHVTLARRARAVEDDAVDAVRWPVADLALVESLPAGKRTHYEVLERWPLEPRNLSQGDAVSAAAGQSGSVE